MIAQILQKCLVWMVLRLESANDDKKDSIFSSDLKQGLSKDWNRLSLVILLVGNELVLR